MREIDVEQLETALQGDITLVDVREPMEFAQAHVSGSILVPMGQLASRLNELDRSRPVAVICRSGNRSAAMCQLLDANGFEAANVVGGLEAWVRAGKPYAQGLG